MIKYFRFSWEFILWGISWKNLLMLLNTIPVYDAEKPEIVKEVEGFDDLADFLI